MEIISRFSMRFFFEQQWFSDAWVNFLFEIFELLRNTAIASCCVSNNMSVFAYIVEAKFFIDVSWFRLSELREPNVVVSMVRSPEHNQILSNNIFPEFIFWQHSHDCVCKNSLRVFLNDIFEKVFF